jgi:hypothetical protein
MLDPRDGAPERFARADLALGDRIDQQPGLEELHRHASQTPSCATSPAGRASR